MNWWIFGGVLIIIVFIGGGVGYWIWIATRPKKMTWQAKVYQLGDGVKPPMIYEGQKIRDYKLSDLVPYTEDVVEKIDKKSGATFYWLQKLKKACPAVTADTVEVWGQNRKFVHILLEGDTCTLIKKAYDRKMGEAIFKPLPHDRINMIKTEISEREARIQDVKDILTSITPFIVLGITMLALVSIAYFEVQGMIRIAELNNDGAEKITQNLNKIDSKFCIEGGSTAPDEPVIKEEKPPTIPQ